MIHFEGTSGHFLLYFDSKYTHPRVSHRHGSPPRRDAYNAKPGRSLEIEASLYIREGVHDEFLTPIPWRYPDGKLSCLVITDHADWDTTEKMQALYLGAKGFNSTHVKTTKSVFYGTVGYETADKNFQPDGLDVPAFSAITEKLSEAGHEICPHSIVVRPKITEGNVPIDVVLQALELFAKQYTSGTWIDHGLSQGQAINYSQLGWNPDSEWFIVDLLRQFGFNSIWSYFDPIDYPVKNINQLSAPDQSMAYLKAALQQITERDIWESLNYLKFAAHLRLGPNGQRYIKNLAAFLKILITSDLTLKAKFERLPGKILSVPGSLLGISYWLIAGQDKDKFGTLFPVLYCESGLSLGQGKPDDMLMFSTSTVNNLSTAWSNLDALIGEYGIHLAHTYLCSTGLRYADSAITKDNGKWRVSESFANLLSQIDERIVRNEIWNPTMRNCASWFKTWIQIRIDPKGPHAVQITNPTGNAITGYSLVFPHNTREVSIGGKVLHPHRESPLIYSIDLQSRSSLELSWSEE
jgi:hypothetical protein